MGQPEEGLDFFPIRAAVGFNFSAQETAPRRSIFDENFGTRTTLVSDHRDRFSLPRAAFSPLGVTPVTCCFFEIGGSPSSVLRGALGLGMFDMII